MPKQTPPTPPPMIGINLPPGATAWIAATAPGEAPAIRVGEPPVSLLPAGSAATPGGGAAPVDAVPPSPTATLPGTAPAPATEAAPARKPIDPCPAPDRSLRTTGVVFVHGIGTQIRRETLLDWSRPIIDVLAAWRRDHDADPNRRDENEAFGENPVVSASVVDSADASIEIEIPAWPLDGPVDGRRAKEHWLFTESYWAADVRAPGFGDAVGYLRKHLVSIVFGIARGYGTREDQRRHRLKNLLKANADSPDPVVQRQVEELKRSFDRRWQIVDGLDGVVQISFIRFTLAGLASLAALIALAIYAPLRAIPIDAIKKRVELALVDTFLVDWFADLKIILDDPAQLAAIRTRLKERVCFLVEQGCTNVVLVAHSGGTIVSYETLLRYSQEELPVTKLVTLGEAIKLGWHLEQESDDWVIGNPLRGDLLDKRKDLRWVDVWASYDPAPSGEMVQTDGCPLVAVQNFTDLPTDRRIHVESRPVTNLMNLLNDHGGYWTNDEGFLIPLIRHLDDPTGDGSHSRFYPSALGRTVRTERRRRRVSILLAWRWAAFLSGIAMLAIATWWSHVDFGRVGASIADVFNLLPAHELVTGPVDGIGHAVAVVLLSVGLNGVAEWLDQAGRVLLGLLLPIALVLVVFARGTSSWTAHDRLERIEIRKERFGPPGRPSARSEGILLTGGLFALVLAAFLPSLSVMVAVLVIFAVGAFIARAS